MKSQMSEEVFEDVEELNTEQTKFQETETQDVEEPHSAELNTEQTEWQGTEILGAEEGQHEVTGNQEFQQNFEDQIPTIQKRESNFCLKMVFGKCGGRVSCKGFDVVITESCSESRCETQPISLKILYELPSASYRKPDEILLSPFIMVGNMSEDVSELRLTLPFLRDLPEDTDSMAKWIRFYGAPSGNDTPVWRDIRTAYEMGAFMVEIRKDHAKLCTQQNVTFCIMGSRIEPAVVYDYDAGLEEENYGAQYNYNFEEYASYYGDYGAENYGENCYNESNDFGNIPVGKVKTSAENNNTPDNFSLASMGVQKALENPIPRPALGLPPEPPTKPPPSKPSSSTFDDAPVKIETRKKFKVKKVWKTTKSKKKDK
ncbi:uncharacterized protein LOC114521735 [Dendronephthya gigantea]|uniref:uncharacterized protein LOC114521735 n=1 Tax=Dendronephthya gigantea TaxID=151771 RepID=UPI00106D8868|nr:uncharacterized protein LOC114521735 [Dendronephthya gigantea]